MRYLHVLALACGVILLGLSAYSTLDAGQRRVAEQLDATLTAEATQLASNIEGYFERARALNLLLANNPSFARFYELSGSRADKVAARNGPIDDVEEALAYLEQLYPRSIGEVCFIDHGGPENARVVRGEVAAVDDLSPDESGNPFFAPTFALAPGQVHQAAPYLSPDTGEWVISNSTPVATTEGTPAIVHFEVTLESFRERAAENHDYRTRIVDGTTGTVLVDSDEPVDVADADGLDFGALPQVVTSARTKESQLLDVGTERMAFRRVTQVTGNVNDWIVVAQAPLPTGVVATSVGPLQAGLMVTAIFLLVLSILSYRVQQRRLERVALTDELTGLPNRTLFGDRVAQALLDAKREGLLTVVAMLDVDRFKDVNDTLGHHVGDRVLSELGRRFTESLREADTIARLGGDEFGLVLQRLMSSDDVRTLMDRVVESLDAPVVVDDVPVHVSVSIGVAVAPADGDDTETLLQHADMAMYEAKRTGEDVLLYSPSLDTFDPRRLAMVPELRAAIEAGEVTAHFQPKLRLEDGAVEGVEVLARWTHDVFGVVSPVEFIALAEETGLIKPLTVSILDQALQHCRHWMDIGIDVPVSVNLSVRNLEDPDIVQRIEELLTRHGVPSEMLKIEITESVVLSEAGRALLSLDRMRAQGIELSLDDFGTGHSSLSHIRKLPVNELKIDRSFVMSMMDDAADESIVRTAIQLGRDLGLRTVAEGVENETTRLRLAELGCDVAQGFLFSRPLPPGEILPWLEGVPGAIDGAPLHHTAGTAASGDPGVEG